MQQFDSLDPPFDANTVYSSHNHVVPALERGEGKLDQCMADLVAQTRAVVGSLPVDWAQMEGKLNDAIYQGVFSQMLLPAFAEQFRGMSENEIDRLMQSFLLRNCIPREGFVRVISEWTRSPRGKG